MNLNLSEFQLKGDSNLQIKKISQRDIAIIGISCRMPLADHQDQFWDNIRTSKDCIRPIPDSRREDLDAYLKYLNTEFHAANYQEGAYIEDIDKFDYTFFDISPKEAELTDPNQRLFLETAWGAIEDAGYGGKRLVGSMTGVYIGSEGGAEYKKFIEDIEPSSLSIAVPGNIPSIIASRISYLLDLKGPCMMVDTACSSALVAVHLACQAIRNGECDIAIAGGIRIYLLPFRQTEIGVESSDGRTKTFDHYSDGLGAGEGVIAMLLKPLSKAIKDHDNIYAVIKGSAVNQDGTTIGITAPNAIAQEEVIARAWKDAGIDPSTISYIEAHGSGTKLGDPVEISGISKAFRRFTKNKQFCAVSSVKTNIGHLDTASGIAGLLRAVLAIKYRKLPPTLHFNRPNQKIPFVESPVYVNDELTEWVGVDDLLRCGVSSFGISGTNCHVVLENPPQIETEFSEDRNLTHILALSAKDEASLKRLVEKYNNFLEKSTELNVGDICFTSNLGRGAYRYRLAMVLKDTQDLINKIAKLNSNWNEALQEDEIFYGWSEKDPRKEDYEYNWHHFMKQIGSYTEGSEAETLMKICDLYIHGTDIDWNVLYKEGLYRKLSLPTYPFTKKRCWIKISKLQDTVSNMDNEFFYTTGWERSDIRQLGGENETGCTLLLAGKLNQIHDLGLELKSNGSAVIEVTLGDRFEKISDHEYIITGTEVGYEHLIDALENQEEQVTRVIHTFTLNDSCGENSLETLRSKKELGVHNLFRLVKAIQKSVDRKQIDLVLITQYVHEITGDEERIDPSGALMLGFGKMIGWESPNLKCRCIDVDQVTDVKSIVTEIKNRGNDYKVAYRKNERFIEVLKKVDLAQGHDNKVSIKENGVYVITGGMGRIGLTIARFLASRNRVKLFLINRSQLPEKDKWGEIVSDNEQSPLKEKIKQVLEIEEMGSTVYYESVDITNEYETEKLFEKIRARFGCINGVIHSAAVGVGVEGIKIEHESEELFRSVMAPKVEGTWILDRITCSDKLDFFILFSSAITLIGGVGGGDYTAANSYLDSFAAYGRREGKRTQTIAWPVWEDSGPFQGVKHTQEKQIFKIVTPDQAMVAFNRVMAKDEKYVIIGDFNYRSSVFELENLLPFKLSTELKELIAGNQKIKSHKSGNLDQDILLKGKNGQEYTKIENLIAKIWREVLGYDEFNINDNFFEIGGDSIRIQKMQVMIAEHFPGKVLITDLFAYPTIYKLAEYIASLEETKVKENENLERNDLKVKITEMLKEVETGNISLDNAITYYTTLGEEK